MLPSMLSIILAYSLDFNSKLANSSDSAICTKEWCDFMRYVQKAKEIAKKKGIAFTHVSTTIGKSPGYLSEMLASKRDLSENLLGSVADALGVTVAELTGEQKEKALDEIEGLKKKATPLQLELIDAVLGMDEKQLILLRRLIDAVKVSDGGSDDKKG